MGTQQEIADPYGVLNLSRTADAEELKRAYRKLSMVWHPDRHASASETQRREAERRFKLINAAYVAIGELLRERAATLSVSAQVAQAARADARVEAIRSVVASAALRMAPGLPRHIYRRLVGMVEVMLLDSVALGERAFAGGFDAFVREAIELAGLGNDVRGDALRVLDAAADDLRWRGKGADPETWQTLLAPLGRAMHPEEEVAASARPARTTTASMDEWRFADLRRPEPLLQLAQAGMVVLFLLLLTPVAPLSGGVRVVLALLDLAGLGYVTFGAPPESPTQDERRGKGA